MAFIVLLLFVLACFLLVVFRGAPYVPTHKASIDKILALVPKEGTFVDLGSGDGSVVKAVAATGRRALGVELNPLLVFISRLRIRAYSDHAHISMRDFWLQHLPRDVSVVFVFLAGPFMAKFENYIKKEAERLGRDVMVLSYGFEMAGAETVKKDGPLVLQRVSPLYKKPTNSYHKQ